MELKKNKNLQLVTGLVVLGFLVVGIVGVIGLRGVFIETNIGEQLRPPSPGLWLGTDELGRDLLSSIICGLGLSLLIGITVVAISGVSGVILGMVSGLAGGLVDMIIMRTVDIILAFPGILLAMALVTFFRQGVTGLIVIFSICGWGGYARLVRGEVLKHKQLDYVLIATCYNASFGRIIYSHLWPVIRPLLIVQATLDTAGVILAESGLNFLGLGISPDIPTLGQLLGSGSVHLFDAPHLLIYPGLMLFLLILSLNFIGEGLSKKYGRE
ncbi:MAG: ABC transporter permease [bacterium]|nr:ABC transporter permease [bacterium]